MQQLSRAALILHMKMEASELIFLFQTGINYIISNMLGNNISFRYPMDPPQLKFLTKVYHPNIDNTTGLICLDLLKMPPQGKWRPIINLSLILTSIQQLLSEPNPHDPLDAAIVTDLN